MATQPHDYARMKRAIKKPMTVQPVELPEPDNGYDPWNPYNFSWKVSASERRARIKRDAARKKRKAKK